MKNVVFAVAGVLAGLAIQAVGMQLTLVAMVYGWDGPFSGGLLFGALIVLLFLLPTGVCAGMAARRHAFLIPALAGAAAERTLYRQLYARPHLDQVLFSIGLIYMAIAAASWLPRTESATPARLRTAPAR